VAGEQDEREEGGGSQAGFTLLELMVVLAILGFLAFIATPPVLRYLSKAQQETARIQLQNIGTAIDLFRFEAGRYPTTGEGLQALLTRPPGLDRWNGPYVTKQEMLVDPWKRPYQYRSPGQHGAFDLWSFGADGQPGGDGDNRDVVNW
jgi:general secretion pathway protein G